MVFIRASNATITDHLNKKPATTYNPRIEPDLFTDPIITVRSQPLPDFGVDTTLDDIIVKLADYGETIPLEKIVPDEEF
ncbi:hypothetical protein DXG03_000455 [Asterophora parasitica]|uniref:Uncharacterized protein n=1 Tax=Asterophora parasitica TaxID=117018 RepID=A0A9P7KG06_9AGAR|nr:hypothetical protein DXG03_000455 [Asterophora parasitica]